MLLNGLIEFYPTGNFCWIFVLLGLRKKNLPWGSEGWFIKSELSAEVLSTSDSDLFGFVTIKVSGDRYLSYGILDKLAKWSGQSRKRIVFFDPSHGQRTGNYSPDHKHALKSHRYQAFSPHPDSGYLSLDENSALYLISLKDTSEMEVWSIAVGIGDNGMDLCCWGYILLNWTMRKSVCPAAVRIYKILDCNAERSTWTLTLSVYFNTLPPGWTKSVILLTAR